MKYSILFALLAGLMVGCNGAADEGKELTSDQQKEIVRKAAANNPNMPPEAKAAMEAQAAAHAGGQGH